MVVNPLGARELDVGGDVWVVAGWPLHHDWQTVLPGLQAAIPEHWEPLQAARITAIILVFCDMSIILFTNLDMSKYNQKVSRCHSTQ